MDPQVDPQSAPAHVPPAPTNRKKLLIIGAIIAGIVILPLLVVFIVGMVHGSKNASDKDKVENLKPGTITGPYVEREHYPRKNIGSAIADATAVEFNSSKDFVKTTKGTVIYPACTVVTQADLRKLSFWPVASPTPGATTMSYVDGSGSGTINFSSTGLPTSDESNECSYTLQ